MYNTYKIFANQQSYTHSHQSNSQRSTLTHRHILTLHANALEGIDLTDMRTRA